MSKATSMNTDLHESHFIFSWDEWVPENRVLKYNDDNVKRRQELARQCGERSKKDNKKGEFSNKRNSWSCKLRCLHTRQRQGQENGTDAERISCLDAV